MEDKIKLLMETTGCNQYEAELAFKSAKGNFVEALDFLNCVSPGLGIIKGKFFVSDKYIYGLFLIIYDVKQQNILTTSAIISLNPRVYEFSLESSWEDMERFIYSNRLEGGVDVELSNKLQEKIFIVADEILATSEIKSEEERFKDILKEIFLSESITVDINFSNEPYKTQTTASINHKDHLNAEIQFNKIILTLELVADPQQGVPAKQLERGDIVWIKMTDDRDIAQYLFACFGGVVDGRVVPLACQINSVEKNSENIVAGFKFTDSVFGYASVSREFRAKFIAKGGAEALSLSGLLKKLFRS